MMALVAAGIFAGVGAGVEDVKAEVYTYPIMPSDPEWANYNHAELVDMLQIPEDILAEMTDEDLVDSVLSYPWICDIRFYDDYNVGVQIVADNFNGLKELLNRPSAQKILLSRFDENKLFTQGLSHDFDKRLRAESAEILLIFFGNQGMLTDETKLRFMEPTFEWKYDVKTPRGTIVKNKK